MLNLETYLSKMNHDITTSAFINMCLPNDHSTRTLLNGNIRKCREYINNTIYTEI